jgi:hypothetical protein
MTPICFLDTETTSLRPDRQAWEIAIIRRDDQGETETTFMVDVDLTGADPFSLKIGGFYQRHPYGQYLAGNGANPRELADLGLIAPKDGYLTRPTAAVTVARLTHGAHIVGAVPNFDTEVLGQLLREHRLTPAWHYHLIDVENLAVGCLHGHFATIRAGLAGAKARIGEDPALDAAAAELTGVTEASSTALRLPWSSDDLSKAIGVEPASDEDRHTALGDARWARRIYDKIMSTGDA